MTCDDLCVCACLSPLSLSVSLSLSLSLSLCVCVCLSHTVVRSSSFTLQAAAAAARAPSPALVLFWQSLPHSQLGAALSAEAFSATPGRVFTVPNNAHILGRGELGSTIYLRPSYQTAYDKIKARLTAAHKKGLVVVGTPGIGQFRIG